MLSSRTTGGIVSIRLVTGGADYVTAPTVALTGGGGTGATAICHMAGTRVESVVIVNQGTGYTSAPTVTLSAATGSGAQATASVYAGSLRPMSFFQGRFGDVYGVDGMGRGIRWDNSSTAAEPIGLVKPAVAPAVATTSTTGQYVKDVVIVRQGAGYVSEPSVVFSGGSPATAAEGRAVMQGGRIVGVRLTNRGKGYQAQPTLSFSGGIGTSSIFNVGILGKVGRVAVINGGGGYGRLQSVTGDGAIGVTSATSSNYINAGVHGITEDAPIYFASLSGNTDLTAGTTYYAVSVNATQLQAATTTGGTGITLTAAITAGVLVDPSQHLYFYKDNHGMSAGSTVTFSALSEAVSVDTGVEYFATSVAATRFKVAASPGGSPVVFTGSITAGTVSIPPARIEFGSDAGLTSAATLRPNATVTVQDGSISTVSVLSGGTGATTNSTAAIVGGGGTGAVVQPVMDYRVASITAATSGAGFYSAPIITIRPAAEDATGIGAEATATVNDSGQITGVTVDAGGSYAARPTALVLDTTAEATATLAAPVQGKYICAIRYIDDTPRSLRGPVASSISDIAEVETITGSGSLEWSFTHAAVDDRVFAMELWRSTADQATVLFRVATIAKTDPEWSSGYLDTLSDPELVDSKRIGYGVLPITLPSGQANARRFGVPLGSLAVGVMFQDRAWYAVDTTGERPNSLFYSEIDEPESVPEFNELVVQQNVGDPDVVRALIPLSSELLIAQDAHLYRLAYVAQPAIDASITLVGYRGVLNPRCWAVMGGVAFIADSFGIYAFDGSSEDPISVAIDNYWRDGIVDLSKSDQFHMASDFDSRTVRFYYCKSSDTAPTRALCYSVATRSWWEETYPEPVTATANVLLGNRYENITSSTGSFYRRAGVTDQGGQGVEYRFRSGNMPLTDQKQGSRTLRVIYRPTSDESNLSLRLYYNNSDVPRNNAVSSDRGDGFVASGGSDATLNMQLQRSHLGDSPGQAAAHYSGRVDPRSAGADKHMAVELAGTQAGTEGNRVVVHGVAIDGVA